LFFVFCVSDADRMREKQKLADLKKQGLLPKTDQDAKKEAKNKQSKAAKKMQNYNPHSVGKKQKKK